MEKFDRGEFVFWGTLWSIVITATGFFGYYMFILAQSFLRILT
jgi:hypothetical protein